MYESHDQQRTPSELLRKQAVQENAAKLKLQKLHREELIKEVLTILDSERKYSPLTLDDVCSYDKVRRRVLGLVGATLSDGG